MPAYQDKSNKTWYCKFYYFDAEGISRQKLKRGFKLKRDAEAWERQFLESIAYQPTMTMDQFYGLFKRDTEPRLKEHTIMNRYYLYKNRIQPFFGDMQLNEIDAQDVITWQNELIEQDFANTYLKTCHTALSTIFNHAVKFYGLGENPCHKAGSIGSTRPETEMLIWTLEDYKKAIDSIESIKARTAINLLYWSGMRKGELYALTWKDLDFNLKTVDISKSYQRLRGKDVTTPPKTASSYRKIKLPYPTLEALKTYSGAIYDTSSNQPVFHWEKRFIEDGIQQAAELAGVQRIRVHDLRHSHASHLIELGFSPLLIAQRLGHEKVETTMNTYAHLWPSKEDELIATLEDEIK